MITYKLNNANNFAQKVVNGILISEWFNTETNQAYLAWLALGNTPLPADEVTP